MATLNSYFDEFLSNINPDPKMVKRAVNAHEPIREHLATDEEFQDYYLDSFLYGSYRRHTAVGDIKDVDIVVLTKFDHNKDKPRAVLAKLKRALARYYENPDLANQRRSIRVDDPLPDDPNCKLTLDIIPAAIITDENGVLKVPDREDDCWIDSHPKGHLQVVNDLNAKEYSDERFVPLVKIMKSWWKYQCGILQPEVERPHPKGFWVECMTMECFDRHQKTFAEHFVTVLANAVTRYANPSQVPQLSDPAMVGQCIKTSMTLDEFKFFLKAMEDSLKLARQALAEDEITESAKIWGRVFGDKFPKPPKGGSSGTKQGDNPKSPFAGPVSQVGAAKPFA